MFPTKKYYGKLAKKQTEEIGTFKSPTKPMYLAKQAVEECLIKQEELQQMTFQKDKIETDIKQIEEEIRKEEEALKLLQELEQISYEEKMGQEKILMHKNAKEELIKTKKELQEELAQKEEVKEQNRKSFVGYFISIFLVLIAATFLALKIFLLAIPFAMASILSFLWSFWKNQKQSKEEKRRGEELARYKKEIQDKIELIEREENAKERGIQEEEEALNFKIRLQKEQIKLKHPYLFEAVENQTILRKQSEINELKLKANQKRFEQNQMNKKLEELLEVEEKLKNQQELFKELIEYDEVITIAKEALQQAYLEMKESITPKFTQNLSKAISRITDGKYQTVKINEENSFSLETENGNYITADYLSLRYH